MKYRIILELDTTKAVYEQVRRNGLQLVREGEGLAVKVPNRVLTSRNFRVTTVLEEKPAAPAEGAT